MDKKQLRIDYLAKRNKLTAHQFSYLNQQITDQLTLFILTRSINNLHVFLPIEKHKEVNLWPFVNKLSGKINIICSCSNLTNGTMSHFYINSNTTFTKNRWGIPEPTDGLPVQASEIEMVLVPLLIADEQGHRVGYGKGFYDRFLADTNQSCLKIGLSLFEPIKNIADVEPHDIRLTHLITPKKVYTFNT